MSNKKAGIAPAGPTYGLYDQRDDGGIHVITGGNLFGAAM